MKDAIDSWLAEEALTHVIIGAFFRVYNALGCGPEANFQRLYAPNSRKRHRPNPHSSD